MIRSLATLRHALPAVLAAFLMLAAAPAQAALDRGQLERIVAVAQELGDLAVTPGPIAADPRTPGETPQSIERAFGGAAMADAVINVINQSPDDHAEAVAAAVAAAPALADPIVSRVSKAFPEYRDSVLQAASLAQQALLPVAEPPASQQAVAPEPQPPQAPAEPAPAGAVGTTGQAGPAVQGGDDFEAIEAALYDEEAVANGELSDPIEGFNRFVFAINDFLDTIVLRPIASFYGFVAPEEVKTALRHFFRNLNEPVVFANELLQFEGEAALITLGRFVTNSTVGGAGLFEVAEDWGMPPQTADFGQTLYKWGVGPGPYLVLPLIGPNSARHGVGRGVDTLLHPRTWILPTEANLALTGGQVLVIREQLLEPLDQLKLGALDYYTALKSAYWQNRQRTLREEQGTDAFVVGDDNVESDFDAIDENE